MQGQLCRGFSFVENANITIDFSRCKAKGLSRCDLFYGCTAIVATRKVTDPMKCFSVAGFADCPTTTRTEVKKVTADDASSGIFSKLVTSSGPTTLGWIVFSSIVGGLILIL